MTIKYIFKSGRKIRLNSLKEYPEEFFYGFNYLRNKGIKVDLIEEEDLFIFTKRGIFDYINKFLNLFIDFPFYHFIKLLSIKNLSLLNGSKIIIVSTNSMGLALGLLKQFGFIKKPILFIVMGILPLESNLFKVYLYRYILKNINLICLSNNEKNYLIEKLNNQNISYIPFGIDSNFWVKNEPINNDNKYIFAIGNDYARDWDTLIKSWENDFPNLRILTSSKIKTNKRNIEIIKSEWGRQIFTDEEIRNFYLGSLFVVLPLRDTIQPSGQSCCLQAMACGRPVIMTKTKGLWDENLLQNKENLILVKTESSTVLKNAIKDLLKNQELQNKLSLNGQKLIEENFNNKLMSEYLRLKIYNILRN